jgi:bifunctional enzyme CysN/CysC
MEINKFSRATEKSQRPICIWMTGLSAAGKSTIANLLEQRLYEHGFHTYLLDGDVIRHGLNKDLGYADADRHENIRRLAEVAHLMVDAGLIVIVSSISPFRRDRAFARLLFEEREFFEIFVDASIEECIRRDPKGLYKKALSGQLLDFTGVSSIYEVPEYPDIHLYTKDQSPDASVDQLFNVIHRIIK